MSFGWSVSDIALLVRLAYKTMQGARAACGEYEELTRETYGLHVILQRLQIEADKPDGFINRPGETYKQELKSISSGCQHVLTQLDKILEKYNALSDQERSVRKLWKQVRFVSGVVDVAGLRSKITSYTAALSLFINLVSMKTVGEVERQMNRAGGDLRDIKIAVNGITARLSASAAREGSVFTAYTNDDKDAWRELRRGLVRQGFRDCLVRKHMRTIMAYVEELGTRGILDDVNDHKSGKGSGKPGMQDNVYQTEDGAYSSPSSIRTNITNDSPDQIEPKSPTVDLSPITAITSPNLSSDYDSKTNGLSNIPRQPYVESASEHESDTDNILERLEQVELCPTSPQHPDIVSHDAAELAKQNSSFADILLPTEPLTDSEEEESHQEVTYRSGYAPGKHPRKASDTATGAQINVQPQDTGAVNAKYVFGSQGFEDLLHSLGTCTCEDTHLYTNLLQQMSITEFISDERGVDMSPLHDALLTVQTFHSLVKSLLNTRLPDQKTRGDIYSPEETLKAEDPEETGYQDRPWEFKEHVAKCMDILSQMAAICKQCEGAEPVLKTLRTITSDQIAALCVDFVTAYELIRSRFLTARRGEATYLKFVNLAARTQAWCDAWCPQSMRFQSNPFLAEGAAQRNFLLIRLWCAGRWGNGMTCEEIDLKTGKNYCAFHDRPSVARGVDAFGETSTICQYYLQAFQPRPDDTIPFPNSFSELVEKSSLRCKKGAL